METLGSGHGRNGVEIFLQGAHFGHPSLRPDRPVDGLSNSFDGLSNSFMHDWTLPYELVDSQSLIEYLRHEARFFCDLR